MGTVAQSLGGHTGHGGTEPGWGWMGTRGTVAQSPGWDWAHGGQWHGAGVGLAGDMGTVAQSLGGHTGHGRFPVPVVLAAARGSRDGGSVGAWGPHRTPRPVLGVVPSASASPWQCVPLCHLLGTVGSPAAKHPPAGSHGDSDIPLGTAGMAMWGTGHGWHGHGVPMGHRAQLGHSQCPTGHGWHSWDIHSVPMGHRTQLGHSQCPHRAQLGHSQCPHGTQGTAGTLTMSPRDTGHSSGTFSVPRGTGHGWHGDRDTQGQCGDTDMGTRTLRVSAVTRTPGASTGTLRVNAVTWTQGQGHPGPVWGHGHGDKDTQGQCSDTDTWGQHRDTQGQCSDMDTGTGTPRVSVGTWTWGQGHLGSVQ
ncbi:uncharacterized protein LOC119699617 [Motacilla alba alba]|uniref:uncharacterized protein LOC119699617 n=1 Tax=Motacilla alba alba TaxID=1094192 RepID=UPI0018D523A0|nr:uncharacterized protein LOC119699617 [Motacilla alba alba]